MALKNSSANCFRKFKGLQLTFQVVSQHSPERERRGGMSSSNCETGNPQSRRTISTPTRHHRRVSSYETAEARLSNDWKDVSVKAVAKKGDSSRCITSETRLGRLTVLGQVLCWHQDPQNVLTAVALGKQLFDKLEQTLQRVPSYRPNLLSDGDGTLCERKPFCFRS
jgi:hypothetical protein